VVKFALVRLHSDELGVFLGVVFQGFHLLDIFFNPLLAIGGSRYLQAFPSI
jgi:hypothetical protein